MAQRDKQVEYVSVINSRGETRHTLDIRLYAPDGSIFTMPHGGDPLLYVARGYKTSPDQVWQSINEEYERLKAVSLKRSMFQGSLKGKEAEILAKKELLRQDELMKQQDEEMQRLDAELDAQRHALDNPAPAVKPIAVADPVPSKKKPGRQKKQEA